MRAHDLKMLLDSLGLKVTVSSEPRMGWAAWLSYDNRSIPYRGDGRTPIAAIGAAFSVWAHARRDVVESELDARKMETLRWLIGLKGSGPRRRRRR